MFRASVRRCVESVLTCCSITYSRHYFHEADLPQRTYDYCLIACTAAQPSAIDIMQFQERISIVLLSVDKFAKTARRLFTDLSAVTGSRAASDA